MNKVIAVVVFLVLIFMGTYFAKVSHGGAGSVFIGYSLGAAAFIFAPMMSAGTQNQPPAGTQNQPPLGT